MPPSFCRKTHLYIGWRLSERTVPGVELQSHGAARSGRHARGARRGLLRRRRRTLHRPGPRRPLVGRHGISAVTRNVQSVLRITPQKGDQGQEQDRPRR